MKRALTLLLLVAMASFALAQAAPQKTRFIVPGRYLIRDMQVNPVFASGPQGLYLLNKGMLARYDAQTLQQQAQVALYGTLDDISAEDVPAQAQWSIVQDRGKWLVPAKMGIHGDSLIILIGDLFFRLDPSTLEIKVKKSLLAEGQPQGMRIDDYLFAGAPQLEFIGDTLYKIHNPMMFPGSAVVTAVDTKDGKVMAEKELPSQLTTTNWKPVNGGITFDANYYSNGQPKTMQWQATPDAIYLLRYGALAKLDPHTLDALKITELFGAIVNIEDEASKEAKTLASIDRAQRQLPPVLLVQGKELLVVSGDQLFRVNADTLAISKRIMLTQVADKDLTSRMNQLIAYGQPQVQLTKKGLLITRGKECLLVNLQDNSVHPLLLPAPLTSALPFLRPRPQVWKAVPPEDGKTIQMNGVVWSEEKDGATTWTMYAPQYGGEFVLTGPNLGKISGNPNADGGTVMLQGTFHKKADGKVLGTIEVSENANSFGVFGSYNVNGVVRKQKVGDQTVWTISGLFEGDEYVLVGSDKFKELTAVPDLDGRQAMVMGTFSKEYEKVPPYGHGYLEVTNYNLPPTPETTADKQDQARPSIPATTAAGFYAVRNGVIVRFDAETLTQKAVRDLLPPAPEIPKAGAISDELFTAVSTSRGKRIATPQLVQVGNDLAVLTGGGFFLVDGSTLEVKAKQEQFPTLEINQYTQQPAYLVDGTNLFTVLGNELTLLDLTKGETVNSVDLSKQMLHKLFPEQM